MRPPPGCLQKVFDEISTCARQAGARNWCFASDNTGGMHPDILSAVQLANDVPATAPYGECVVTKAAEDLLRRELGLAERDVVRFVASGTGGNTLGLAMGLGATYQSIVAARCAHVATNTVGAVEKMLGARTLLLPDKKVRADALRKLVQGCHESPEFYTFPKVVTLTQPTEYGELYSFAELEEIRQVADDLGMFVHIDGARVANAVVALSDGPDADAATLKRLLALCDAMTWGGAKNGAGVAEAVIVKQTLGRGRLEVSAASKQMNLVVSKLRYVSAQLIALFTEGLWARNARHANEHARLLHTLLSPEAVSVALPETNQVFATITRAQLSKLLEHYELYYTEDDGPNHATVRIVTSWDTADSECRHLASLLGA